LWQAGMMDGTRRSNNISFNDINNAKLPYIQDFNNLYAYRTLVVGEIAAIVLEAIKNSHERFGGVWRKATTTVPGNLTQSSKNGCTTIQLTAAKMVVQPFRLLFEEVKYCRVNGDIRKRNNVDHQSQ